jgi:large subunit ribosomal protein L22
MKESKAVLKNIRMSSRKVNLVAATVRGLPAKEAVNVLKFTQKAAARPLKKVIQSAVANAVNNNDMKEDQLVVKTIEVGPATTMKRLWPRSRGQGDTILKRTSHVTVLIAEKK